MRTVYVVRRGFDYEDSGITGVYSSYESAYNASLMYLDFETERYPLEARHKRIKDIDGYSYITIEDFEVEGDV